MLGVFAATAEANSNAKDSDHESLLLLLVIERTIPVFIRYARKITYCAEKQLPRIQWAHESKTSSTFAIFCFVVGIFGTFSNIFFSNGQTFHKRFCWRGSSIKALEWLPKSETNLWRFSSSSSFVILHKQLRIGNIRTAHACCWVLFRAHNFSMHTLCVHDSTLCSIKNFLAHGEHIRL